jgi:hypothetical protein
MSGDRMSNPNDKPVPKPNMEIIPVRLLRFGHHNPTEIPGASGQNSISASDEKNRSRFKIEFIPAWRHHRVTFTPVESQNPPTVTLVHESKVASWEPLG